MPEWHWCNCRKTSFRPCGGMMAWECHLGISPPKGFPEVTPPWFVEKCQDWKRLLTVNNPLCVFSIIYLLDSSSKNTCWYAWLRSSLLYFSLPANFSNRSSGLGIGYFSSLDAWLTKLVISTNPHWIIWFKEGYNWCYPLWKFDRFQNFVIE